MATITKLPSGAYRAQVRKSGLYRAATHATKGEAQRWAAEVEKLLVAQATGVPAAVPVGTTLSTLIEVYRRDHAKSRSWGRSKEAALALLDRQLGTTLINKLTPAHVQAFVDARMEQGAGGVTIAADLSYLGTVLRFAKEVKHLAVDPAIARNARAALSTRGLNTRSQERAREPSDAELEKLYAYWAGNNYMRTPMELLCRFALSTSMRLGEICSLLKADVSESARTVVIRDRKDPQRKLGNNQTVPLLGVAWDLLAPQLAQPGSRVFPYDPKSVSCAFTRAVAACEIPDLHFHDLRHKAAADFFRAGLDIPRVALMTGHKDWKMLKRYTELTAADVHAAFNKLNN